MAKICENEKLQLILEPIDLLPRSSNGNEFISESINSTHARGWSRKGRFDTEKQGKGRKKGAVRGRVPRKQGLKHLSSEFCARGHFSPRASSTKTRIETERVNFGCGRKYCPRASSTKTRIETQTGLCPCNRRFRPRASSTKTRIETFYTKHP